MTHGFALGAEAEAEFAGWMGGQKKVLFHSSRAIQTTSVCQIKAEKRQLLLKNGLRPNLAHNPVRTSQLVHVGLSAVSE